MSTVAQLPATARRLFRGPTSDEADGINTPGQYAGAEETWQVPCEDSTAFFNTVFGSVEVVGGPSGVMARVVPLRHPEFPGLLATGYRATRVGWNAARRFWKYRNITVRFRTPIYNLDGQSAYISVATAPSARSIPTPAVAFRIGGAAPVYDPGFPIQGTSLQLTTYQLPTLPLDAYYTVQGHCNQGTFWGYPEGTVLYHGPQATRTQTIAGVTTYQVTHLFDASGVPWNHGFLPDGTLSEVTRADGSLNHPKTDLNAVFN